MNDPIGSAKECINDVADSLRCLDLSSEYEYKLRKDIMHEPVDSVDMRKLKSRVLGGEMAAEAAGEQLWHGGWARFGTEDLTVKKKVPTTVFGVRRLLWLGLTAEDEPLGRALEYCTDLFEGRRMLPEGGEVNERWPEVLRIRCAMLIASIDLFAPCLDSIMERWRFIAGDTFRGGSYDYAVCRDLQAMMLNVQGPRLIPIPLQLLAARPGFLSEELNRMLLLYCWQRHLDGFLWWPEGKLDRLPVSFRNEKTSRYMNTMESMVCFRNSALVLDPAIHWLLAGRDADGLWDYGPQAKDPAGYHRRLAAMDWKKPLSRKLDCTMEVLVLLKQYVENNMALTSLAPSPINARGGGGRC